MKTKYKSRPLSPKAIIRLYAEHYLNSPEDKISPRVKREFRELIHSRYTDIKNLGIKEVRVSGQQHKNAEELFADFDKNRPIQVSTDHNNPVMIKKVICNSVLSMIMIIISRVRALIGKEN
jgi:hypothetical protein